jgi:hypothetical protein
MAMEELLDNASHRSRPELPDGIISNQKNPIWVNFGGPGTGKC